jgi:hypothetical protein
MKRRRVYGKPVLMQWLKNLPAAGRSGLPGNRKLPPGSRHHEDWCAIYRGKPCDCDDDGDRRPRRRPAPLSGGAAPAPKREKQLEDA